MSDNESTSWSLLAQAAAGQSAALTEFAQRYESTIREQLEQRWHQQPLRQHIGDVIQEVFVECLKPNGVLARADRSAPEGFRRLLAAVVRNVAMRVETRLTRLWRREGVDAGTGHDAAAAQTSMSHRLDREWANRVVHEAAEEQERRAERMGPKALLRVKLLRLHFDEQLRIPEIAELWGLEAAHVHHQYAKARQDFLRALLVVLKRRLPEAPQAEIEAQALHLVELLRGS